LADSAHFNYSFSLKRSIFNKAENFAIKGWKTLSYSTRCMRTTQRGLAPEICW
jgi:hypothetical protein